MVLESGPSLLLTFLTLFFLAIVKTLSVLILISSDVDFELLKILCPSWLPS